MALTFVSGSIEEFYTQVNRRIRKKKRANPKEQTCVMPVGIFLVLDKDNGGDTKAEELINRFFIMDKESSEFIDFYYLGWRMRHDNPVFNINLFSKCRDVLRECGVNEFSGNADIILVDAELSFNAESPILNLDRAMRIDISLDLQSEVYPTVGHFLYAVVRAAKEYNENHKGSEIYSPIECISNSLGIGQARKSLISFMLDQFGKFINAKQLQAFDVKQIGPKLSISDIKKMVRQMK